MRRIAFIFVAMILLSGGIAFASLVDDISSFVSGIFNPTAMAAGSCGAYCYDAGWCASTQSCEYDYWNDIYYCASDDACAAQEAAPSEEPAPAETTTTAQGCAAGWQCSGDWKYYQDDGCMDYSWTYCASGCSGGECKPETASPSVPSCWMCSASYYSSWISDSTCDSYCGETSSPGQCYSSACVSQSTTSTSTTTTSVPPTPAQTAQCAYETGCGNTNQWCYNSQCAPCSQGFYNCDIVYGCESAAPCGVAPAPACTPSCKDASGSALYCGQSDGCGSVCASTDNKWTCSAYNACSDSSQQRTCTNPCAAPSFKYEYSACPAGTSCSNGQCAVAAVQSPAAAITDAQPPSVIVSTSPSGSSAVTLTATASDNVRVSNIKIYVDDDGNPNNAYVVRKECSSSPCPVTLGPYAATTTVNYYVLAYDDAGNYGSSAVSSFTVASSSSQAPPTSTTTTTTTCPAGFANCDASSANGCEVNLKTDSNNCGSCGNACASGGACSNGACTSPPAPSATAIPLCWVCAASYYSSWIYDDTCDSSCGENDSLSSQCYSDACAPTPTPTPIPSPSTTQCPQGFVCSDGYRYYYYGTYDDFGECESYFYESCPNGCATDGVNCASASPAPSPTPTPAQTAQCAYETGCGNTNQWCSNSQCTPCPQGFYNCNIVYGCESAAPCGTASTTTTTTTTTPTPVDVCTGPGTQYGAGSGYACNYAAGYCSGQWCCDESGYWKLCTNTCSVGTCTASTPSTSTTTTTSISAADAQPPSILVSTSPLGDAVTLTATATDNIAVSSIKIYAGEGSGESSLKKECPSSPCSVTFGPYPTKTTVSYYAIAYDTSNNQKTSDSQSFTVSPSTETKCGTPCGSTACKAYETCSVEGDEFTGISSVCEISQECGATCQDALTKYPDIYKIKEKPCTSYDNCFDATDNFGKKYPCATGYLCSGSCSEQVKEDKPPVISQLIVRPLKTILSGDSIGLEIEVLVGDDSGVDKITLGWPLKIIDVASADIREKICNGEKICSAKFRVTLKKPAKLIRYAFVNQINGAYFNIEVVDTAKKITSVTTPGIEVTEQNCQSKYRTNEKFVECVGKDEIEFTCAATGEYRQAVKCSNSIKCGGEVDCEAEEKLLKETFNICTDTCMLSDDCNLRKGTYSSAACTRQLLSTVGYLSPQVCCKLQKVETNPSTINFIDFVIAATEQELESITWEGFDKVNALNLIKVFQIGERLYTLPRDIISLKSIKAELEAGRSMKDVYQTYRALLDNNGNINKEGKEFLDKKYNGVWNNFLNECNNPSTFAPSGFKEICKDTQYRKDFETSLKQLRLLEEYTIQQAREPLVATLTRYDIKARDGRDASEDEAYIIDFIARKLDGIGDYDASIEYYAALERDYPEYSGINAAKDRKAKLENKGYRAWIFVGVLAKEIVSIDNLLPGPSPSKVKILRVLAKVPLLERLVKRGETAKFVQFLTKQGVKEEKKAWRAVELLDRVKAGKATKLEANELRVILVGTPVEDFAEAIAREKGLTLSSKELATLRGFINEGIDVEKLMNKFKNILEKSPTIAKDEGLRNSALLLLREGVSETSIISRLIPREEIVKSLTDAEKKALESWKSIARSDISDAFVSILERSEMIRGSERLRSSAIGLLAYGVRETSIVEVLEKGMSASRESLDEVFELYIKRRVREFLLIRSDDMWMQDLAHTVGQFDVGNAVVRTIATLYNTKQVSRAQVAGLVYGSKDLEYFLKLGKLSDEDLLIILFPENKMTRYIELTSKRAFPEKGELTLAERAELEVLERRYPYFNKFLIAGGSTNPVEDLIWKAPYSIRTAYLEHKLFIEFIWDLEKLPEQGWKLHVSATPETYDEIGNIVLPYLQNNRISHKIVKRAQVGAFNRGELGDTQVGKIITIDTENAEQARKVAQDLDKLLGTKFKGLPLSQGDKVYPGESGIISYRYGEIKGWGKEGITSGHIKDPQGNLVPDVRTRYRPIWVEDAIAPLPPEDAILSYNELASRRAFYPEEFTAADKKALEILEQQYPDIKKFFIAGGSLADTIILTAEEKLMLSAASQIDSSVGNKFYYVLTNSKKISESVKLRKQAIKLIGGNAQADSVIDVLEHGSMASKSSINDVFNSMKQVVLNTFYADRSLVNVRSTVDAELRNDVLDSIMNTMQHLRGALSDGEVIEVLEKTSDFDAFITLGKLSQIELRLLLGKNIPVKTKIFYGTEPQLMTQLKRKMFPLLEDANLWDEFLKKLGISLDYVYVINIEKYGRTYQVNVVLKNGEKRVARLVASVIDQETRTPAYTSVLQILEDLKGTDLVLEPYTKPVLKRFFTDDGELLYHMVSFRPVAPSLTLDPKEYAKALGVLQGRIAGKGVIKINGAYKFLVLDGNVVGIESEGKVVLKMADLTGAKLVPLDELLLRTLGPDGDKVGGLLNVQYFLEGFLPHLGEEKQALELLDQAAKDLNNLGRPDRVPRLAATIGVFISQQQFK